MTAQSNAPPGRWPDGANIENAVAAKLDYSDHTEPRRYCQVVPLRVVVVDLLDKIERAWLLDQPLHLDGIDLLQLHDDHLPLWLGDVRRIIVDSDLAGRWIRDRMKGEGVRVPEIRVGGGHD